MSRSPKDGRRFRAEQIARSQKREDGTWALYSPSPGLWRHAPAVGTLVRPGDSIGELEVLGRLHRLYVPKGAFGVITELPSGPPLGRYPVDYETCLLCLDPNAAEGAVGEAEDDQARTSASGPVFETPLGGRYYARPSPDAPPFIQVGDTVSAGQTVALIEVMKTFNRVKYGGPDLPSPAVVQDILVADGDDIDAHAALIVVAESKT